MKLTLTLLAALALGWSTSAKPAIGPRPTFEQFVEACKATRALALNQKLEGVQVGEIAYYPSWSIEGLQTRFSFERFIATLDKAQVKNGLEWDEGKKVWKFAHNRKSSVYAVKKRLTGIFYRGRIFLIDGHHRALVSLYTGAASVPVHVIADWSDKFSPPKFFSELADRKFSYFENARGGPSAIVDICNMIDDPNLQLARFLIYRVNVDLKGDEIEISNGRGARRPLALKINQDIQFFEFEIADALTRAGVRFDPKRDEDDLTRNELKGYSAILHRAAKRPNSRLSEILLLEEPQNVAKLDLSALIQEHIEVSGCERILLASESDE